MNQQTAPDELTEKIIEAAIEAHRYLGPGLLESTYETCLAHELESIGFIVQRQMILPLTYKGLQLPQAFRIDLLVDGQVVIEIKTVEDLTEVHAAQLLSYLKFSVCKKGLLINFNVKLLKQGIRRFVM